MNNYDFDYDMIPFNTMTGLQNNSTESNNIEMQLFTPEIAFQNGNFFQNLYQQYKNYRPAVLNARTEQERMFLNLSQLAFAAHELNLYLDNHPNDRSIIGLFNDYRNMTNKAIKEYEEKFGPILINSDQLNQSPWMWEQLNFPWEEGGM